MTKAGKKLIKAAMEAVVSARCQHKWRRLSTRVVDRKVVAELDLCEKCGTRRTGFVKG